MTVRACKGHCGRSRARAAGTPLNTTARSAAASAVAVICSRLRAARSEGSRPAEDVVDPPHDRVRHSQRTNRRVRWRHLDRPIRCCDHRGGRSDPPRASAARSRGHAGRVRADSAYASRWLRTSEPGPATSGQCKASSGQVALLFWNETITGNFDYRIHAEESPDAIAAGVALQ